MKTIKFLFLVTLVLLGVSACGSSDTLDTTIPENIIELKKKIAEKKSAIAKIEQELSLLENALEDKAEPEDKKPIPVNALELAYMDFRRYTTVQGHVESSEIVNASSEVGGRIVSLNVREGDYVRRGQVIARTDMSVVQNQVAELETRKELATTVYERQKRLWDQNIGSEIQFLEAENTVKVLDKNIATLKSNLAKANVYSPISGVVHMELLKQGETAAPGMPLVQILNTASVKIVGELQEHLLGKVKRNQILDVYFPALDEDYKMKVSLLGRTIDPANRTFKIEMSSPSFKGKLKPNLLAEIRLLEHEEDKVLTVPLYAIQEEVSGKKYVYIVIEKNGHKWASKKYIDLGESSDGVIVVTEGLNMQDVVVTEGVRDIDDGSKLLVNLQNSVNEQG